MKMCQDHIALIAKLDLMDFLHVQKHAIVILMGQQVAMMLANAFARITLKEPVAITARTTFMASQIVTNVVAMLMVLMVWIVTTMESALASPMLLETSVTNVQQDTPTSLTVTNVIPTIMAILIVNPVLAIPKGLKV